MKKLKAIFYPVPYPFCAGVHATYGIMIVSLFGLAFLGWDGYGMNEVKQSLFAGAVSIGLGLICKPSK